MRNAAHRSDPWRPIPPRRASPGTYAGWFICIAAPALAPRGSSSSATLRTAPKWRSTAF